MKIQRLVVLAAMALAAIAFAVPATASASGTWTHSHKKVRNTDRTIKLTGNLGLEAFGSGFSCEVHAVGTLTKSWDGKIVKTGTGHLTNLTFTTDTCIGFGFFAECTLEQHEVQKLPAMLTAKKTDIEVTSQINFVSKYNAECPIPEVEFTLFSGATLDPDNATTISNLVVTGEGFAHGFGLEFAATAFGKLEFTGAEAKTYGVHEQTQQQEEEYEAQETEEEEEEETEE